ncbi:type VI secretion system protein ImpK [Serratia marcescens]|uniref:Type VI secretion system protein ImpK n=4 Tax=Serratia TaxID=613 RepID=A0AA46K329_SERMA|nr:type IVB secretion system protein IcmH/DotU [Serratia marcescens]TQI83625.1 type VI secretion system protein ImpK [Serratia marcescens]HEJ7119362.1 type IVB secretion system protein IcmH/DotU [Serratia marcescens]
MNEFERKIREAMAVTRNNANPRLPTSGSVGKTTAEIAALSFGARALAAKLRPGNAGVAAPTEPKPYEAESAAPENVEPAPGDRPADAAPTSSGLFGRAALSKPGVMMGHWDNPLIAAAIPVLLQVERVRDQKQLNPAAVRAQIVREIQQFQQTLLADHIAPGDVDKLAYLLCSYVDECCMSTLESGELNLSLLVEFYRDAWGGEKCFEHLQDYLAASPRNKEILAFYDLILSLGFEGQFHVMERGAVLLADVRNRLDGYLYSQNPTQTLADAEPSNVVRKATRITPLKLLCYGLAIALLAYASAAWYLHDQSRALRNAILAWTPPQPRKINIMETLPQPLPQILSEGWLEVRADPRGWLLIFTSDGAFATGQSKLSEEFKKKRNIERLGEALAPWPGDLEVIGHTDNKPYRNTSSNSNLKLSEARAQTVADKLRESLANSKYNRTVTSVGKGDQEPLDDNATEEGRRRNRRVDILWKIGEREMASPSATLNQAGVAAEVPEDN